VRGSEKQRQSRCFSLQYPTLTSQEVIPTAT